MTRRPLFSLGRSADGVAAVEFGLILVPLLMVVMGFGELGWQSYVRANLQATLNDVARSAVVETPDIIGTGTLEERINAEVERRMEKLVTGGDYDLSIRNFKNFAAVDQPEALTNDKNKNGKYDSGDCWEDSNPNGTFDLNGGRSGVGGADDVVVYDIDLLAPHLFPVSVVFDEDGSFNANASTLVRTQPYATQRVPVILC